jgi:TPR repeat protein
MSAPSGKPSHSIALPGQLVRDTRERGAAEPEPTESTDDPPRSPYAPKRAHQRADALPRPVKNDPQSLQSVYDWKGAKEPASVAPDAGLAAEAETLAPARSLHRRPATTDAAPLTERHAINVAERKIINPANPQTIGNGERRVIDAARQAIDAARQAIDESPLCSREQPLDLEGLEASLRWLQRRQAAAMRLPPAPNLPPPRSRPTSADVIAGAHGGERPVDRSPLRSLEPTRLLPPPMGSDRNPNMMLGVSLACILMAGIVYYHLQAGRSPSSQATPESQVASIAPPLSTYAIETERAARIEQTPGALSDGHETVTKAEILPRRTAVSPTMSASQEETVAMLPPATPAGAGGSSSKLLRTLDPEEIDLLVKQAEKHIATGDVVAARLVFQRAAEAGDAPAALALAATYDPTVLAKLGVMGMGADVEKARAWYRMAESFGSAEAKQRLKLLDRH